MFKLEINASAPELFNAMKSADDLSIILREVTHMAMIYAVNMAEQLSNEQGVSMVTGDVALKAFSESLRGVADRGRN